MPLQQQLEKIVDKAQIGNIEFKLGKILDTRGIWWMNQHHRADVMLFDEQKTILENVIIAGPHGMLQWDSAVKNNYCVVAFLGKGMATTRVGRDPDGNLTTPDSGSASGWQANGCVIITAFALLSEEELRKYTPSKEVQAAKSSSRSTASMVA